MSKTKMLDKKVLGYELTDIVDSDEFYQKLKECANITAPNKQGFSYESSMAVNGYPKRFVITKPMKEEERRALSGEHRGLNLNKKGFGLYRPLDAFRILNIHFHPVDTIAIPSEADLYEIPELSKEIFVGTYLPKKVEIVGHKENGRTTLFLKQFLGSHADGEEIFGIVYNGLEQELRKASSKSSKFKLCRLASDYLNDSGHYISDVISFKNRETFTANLDTFSKFDILHRVKEVTDMEAANDVQDVKFEAWLNDYEDELDQEQFGLVGERDDMFSDSEKIDDLFY